MPQALPVEFASEPLGQHERGPDWAHDDSEPEEWAKWALRIRQLQVTAQRLRRETARPIPTTGHDGEAPRGVLTQRLRSVLRMLVEVRAFVDRRFLDVQDDDIDDSVQRKMKQTAMMNAGDAGDVLERIERVLDHARECLHGDPPPTLAELRLAQIRDLEHELAAVRLVADASVAQRLVTAVQTYRSLERCRGFRRRLRAAVTEQGGRYSPDNFAYGSTPFHTWRRVCQALMVAGFGPQSTVAPSSPSQTEEANTNLRTVTSTNGEQRNVAMAAEVVILGSSTGSLVVFSAALLETRCLGVELLSCLHELAVTTSQRLGVGLHCSFVNGDMLDQDISHTQVVVLTSQCWDDGLYERVCAKLADELADGALVVDYRRGLDALAAFVRVAELRDLEVSWNPTQTVSIQRRRSRALC